jgi:molybdopterin-guanine dinucleotide biosynthesis protein
VILYNTKTMTPTIVAISGFSSNAGKTTLACELLHAFPGWEAIKITRGHYRSCGKDPHACCVSHLLSDEPVIRSGRAETYAPGKDTGRYWDAGASNVHWVIVTEQQVERGIKLALERVMAGGVFIEGTGFLKYMDVDLSLMVARRGLKLKASARRVLAKISAIYLSDVENETPTMREHLISNEATDEAELVRALPVYTTQDLPQIIKRIGAIHAAMAA